MFAEGAVRVIETGRQGLRECDPSTFATGQRAARNAASFDKVRAAGAAGAAGDASGIACQRCSHLPHLTFRPFAPIAPSLILKRAPQFGQVRFIAASDRVISY